jgi:hypothetical protein
MPITRVRSGCCARAMPAHNTAVPPRNVTNSRRFIVFPGRLGTIIVPGKVSLLEPCGMPRLVEIISQPLSDVAFATRTMSVDSFEQLRAATPTSSSEIIQVDAGRMQGRLKHATLAGLSLGFGTFSRGLISRGVYSKERITIGFLLGDSQSRSGVGHLDTIRTWPPGAEHERRHRSGASFGAISVTPKDEFFRARQSIERSVVMAKTRLFSRRSQGR